MIKRLVYNYCFNTNVHIYYRNKMYFSKKYTSKTNKKSMLYT